MKPSIVTVAQPASNTNFDALDSNILNDWKGSIIIGSNPTSPGGAANGNMFIGACDGTRNVGWVCSLPDATAGANSIQRVSATYCIQHMSGTVLNSSGYLDSVQPRGPRFKMFTNDATAHLMHVLNFAGADYEFGCSSGLFSTTDTTQTWAHNLTGLPDWLWVIIGNSCTTFDANHGFVPTMGMWDGANSIGWGAEHVPSSNPSVVAARMVAGDLGHFISSTPADFTSFTLGSVGATNITINKGSAGSTSAAIIVIAGRHLSGSAAESAFISTLPAATGLNTVNAGMAVKPQVWINMHSRLGATTYSGNSDTAGSFGVGFAVNNAGVTQQASIACTTKQNVATSVAKSYASSSAAGVLLDNTGAVQGSTTVNAWNAGGIQENVGTAPASAMERMNLALGVTASGIALPLSAIGHPKFRTRRHYPVFYPR